MSDQRQNPEPAGSAGFDFNRPTIIALLYLASFVVGITGLVGLILSYVWKGEPGAAWEASHYQFHIRTFWIGLAGFVIGAILTIVLIGFLIMLAVGAWVLVRSVLAMLRAQRHEPIADPRSLLF